MCLNGILLDTLPGNIKTKNSIIFASHTPFFTSQKLQLPIMVIPISFNLVLKAFWRPSISRKQAHLLYYTLELPKNSTFSAPFLAMHMLRCWRRAKWSGGGSLAWFRLGKESMQIFTFGRYNANINLSTFIAERCLSFVLNYFFL